MRCKTTRQQDNETTSLGRIFLLAKVKVKAKAGITALALALAFVFVSCSPQKKLAYDFVEKSHGVKIALFVTDELQKTNLRSDCNPKNVELVLLDEDQLQDTIDARTRIINKIDDEIFLNVLLSSFESTLKDYNISLEYWENDNMMPDSLHWIVDLSHIEVQEFNKYLLSDCGIEGNCEFFKSTAVNVASWFELLGGDTCEMLFTEHDYYENIVDCGYYMDSTGKWAPYADLQYLTIDGFYNFAVVLGGLYAGYCYDYFMNEYVRKEMKLKGKDYSDNIHMRYDPYESYIYYTRRDRLIQIEN